MRTDPQAAARPSEPTRSSQSLAWSSSGSVGSAAGARPDPVEALDARLGDDGVGEALAELVLAQLHVEAEQPLDHPRRRRAVAAPLVHRRAQLLVARDRALGDHVHHVLRVALDHRHRRLDPVHQRLLLLRLDERREPALAERLDDPRRVGDRRHAAGGTPLDAHLDASTRYSRSRPLMCSRSHGTPPNWCTWVSSWAQTQRPKAAASTSRSATALSRFGPTNSSRGGTSPREQRHVVLAEHAVRRGSRSRARPRRRASPTRPAAGRPPAGPRSSSRSSSRAATGSSMWPSDSRFVSVQPARVSSSAGGRALAELEARVVAHVRLHLRAEGDHVDRRTRPGRRRRRRPAQSCGRSTSRPCRSQRYPASELGKPLYLLDHRGEQVAVLLDPLEHVARLEDELRRDRPPRARSQASGVDTVGRSRARSE